MRDKREFVITVKEVVADGEVGYIARVQGHRIMAGHSTKKGAVSALLRRLAKKIEG